MLAGERKALLRAIDALCVELGNSEGDEISDAPPAGDGGRPWGALSLEDESLIESMRRSLAKVAAALPSAEPGGSAPARRGVILNGAEMVIRGEVARGNAKHLPSLIPGFVFLVALTSVEQDEALGISRRAEELIEKTLAG